MTDTAFMLKKATVLDIAPPPVISDKINKYITSPTVVHPVGFYIFLYLYPINSNTVFMKEFDKSHTNIRLNTTGI